MRIEFKCRTNKDYVAINTLKVVLPSKAVLTIDRNNTEYGFDGNELSMVWKGCYLWAVSDCNIFGAEGYFMEDEESIKEFKRLIKGSKFFFELDEDVDEDYIVHIDNVMVSY